MLFAVLERAVPALRGFFLQIIELLARLNSFHRVAMQLDDAEHRIDVVLRDGFDTCAQRASR